MADSDEGRNGIQVIRRALAILRALAGHGHAGLSLGAIAQRTGLPKSTVQRIIDALAEERMVAPAASGGGSCLGPGIAELAAGLNEKPLELIRQTAKALQQALDESVAICALEGSRVVVLELIASRQALQVVLQPISHVELDSSAAGKAVLSAMPQDELDRRLSKIADRKRLRQEVARVRDDGFATDEEEAFPGVSAAAAAFMVDATIYALVIVAPCARFRERRDDIVRTLSTHARDLAMRIPASSPAR